MKRKMNSFTVTQIQNCTLQWRIKKRGPGGGGPGPSPYFQTKLRPEGGKNVFGDRAPAYVRVWMTPLISRSGSGTALLYFIFT